MAYPPGEEVFYNPVQVQNRDLSVLMIAIYAERRSRRAALICAKKAERKRLLEAAGMTEAESKTKGAKKIPPVDLDRLRSELETSGTDWTARVRAEAAAGRPPAGQPHDPSAGPGGIRILDALAASGLRSVRYAKEIPGVDGVVANDLKPEAAELAAANAASNGCCAGTAGGVEARAGDAIAYMYSYLDRHPSERFDVIDLDPYGTAAPFLDAAVRTVANGGLLCITCTDMASMSGGHPETCYGRLGAMPVPKGGYCQELAIRLMLACAATTAGRCGRTIRPVLSVGMAFYVRCFVEVWDDKRGVNEHCLKIGNLYQSSRCPTFATAPHATLRKNVYHPSRLPLPTCPETGGDIKVAGPLWLAPIHDQEVVAAALARISDENNAVVATGLSATLATRANVHGLLTSVSEELPDVPLYYRLPDLTRAVGCSAPPRSRIENAVHNAGFRVSAQHKEPQAIKTDAPSSLLWDILRAWVLEHPVSEKTKKNNTTAAQILEKEPTHEINFSRPKGLNNGGQKPKAVRYPMNPEPNWGPKAMAKAKRGAGDDGTDGPSEDTTIAPPAKKSKDDDAEEAQR